MRLDSLQGRCEDGAGEPHGKMKKSFISPGEIKKSGRFL